MNRDLLPSLRWLLVMLTTGFASSGTTSASFASELYLQKALAVVDSDRGLCPATRVREPLGATIGRIADEIRADLGANPSGSAGVETLNRRLFSDLGLRAPADLKDPCNLLPSRVLERRQGYCVGIAAIYLALAERLELPIRAVATPSHVFLRYDDGKTRINIETMQAGAAIPDEQYIREQKIPEVSIRRGVFMRNLTQEEFLAQVHNNLGVIYSERGDFARAAQEYATALEMDGLLAAAYYNYANDLLRTGEYRRAVKLFSRSLKLYPLDVWALNNRGLAYEKIGKKEKAQRDFQEALRIDPGFEQARRNLGGS